jgi:hypothetical protein
MAEASSTSRLWWAVPAATVLLLITLTLFLGAPEQPHLEPNTSYDASWKGSRAAYLLLEGLGYPVTRSKSPTGGAARLVYRPNVDQEKAGLLDDWVRDGGALVLADASADFGRNLGMQLHVSDLKSDFEDEPASGGGATRLSGGRVRVDWPGHHGRVWARAGGAPFVTVYDHGRGQVWLLHRPEFLDNKHLKQADNAVLLCRLAETLLAARSGPLSFDEYVHGMRDRPGMAQLLFRPPALWVTLQGLLLTLVLLWHYMPRFGAVRPDKPPRRRSKEEFLDAMAALLERKGDYASAYQTARDEFVRDVEAELALPAGTPLDRLVDEAARRRGVAPDGLRRLLDARPGKASFVNALVNLEASRNEFFHRRTIR